MSDAELLGNELREARLRLNLTLLQAEKQTRIRTKYLEALEQGNYSMLPSGVHARGFLRGYARFLGLDGDLAVARFEEIMSGGRRRSKRVPLPTLVDETPRLKKRATGENKRASQSVLALPGRAVAGDNTRRRSLAMRLLVALVVIALLLTIGGLAVALFGGSLRGVLTEALAQASLGLDPQNTPSGILEPAPTAEVTLEGFVPASTPEATADAALSAPPTSPGPSPLPNLLPAASPEPTVPLPPPGVGDNVLVELRITARTWLQVIRDGEVEYVGVLAPGATLRSTGKQIRIRVANAIGVEVYVNNVAQGVLGPRGAIVDKIYQPGGILLPTPLPAAPSTGASNPPIGAPTTPAAPGTSA
jgi:transcriptional regulator with XRE-family HTH domain